MTTLEELRRQCRNVYRATGRQPITASATIADREVSCTLVQRGAYPVAYLWRVDGRQVSLGKILELTEARF